MRQLECLLALAMLLAAGTTAADAQDCDGCSDHPLLARYPGSQLVGYDQRAFERAQYVRARDAGDGAAPSAPFSVYGKRTRLFYWEPEGRSGREVFANYREALAKAGMTTLWACSGSEECGDEFAGPAIAAMQLDLSNTTEAREGAADAEEPRYLLAQSLAGRSEVHVAILVADLPLHAPPRAGAYVMVTESAPMDSGMVTIDANALARSLAETHKAVVYGIHFDFDQAQITPQSRPQLEQIAQALSDHPQMRLAITGHTDDRGGAQYNLALSQRRADAIVAALVGTYGIAADRLRAIGKGATVPVAGNDSEEGRAQNRRVELIAQ